jgi:hypothetical protein
VVTDISNVSEILIGIPREDVQPLLDGLQSGISVLEHKAMQSYNGPGDIRAYSRLRLLQQTRAMAALRNRLLVLLA